MNSKKNKPEDVWKRINIKNDSECWEWQGSLVNNRYGKMIIDCKYYLTHRVVYELTYGNISDSLLVCHHCDNPKCCNPKHLFLGTQQDNVNDKIKKNRQPKGKSIGSSKLTSDNVLEIRRLYINGSYTFKKLGVLFNVDRKNISSIVYNKTWKHLS